VITDRGAQFGDRLAHSVSSSKKLASALPHAAMNVTPTNVERTFMLKANLPLPKR
jgi:hypothetical protein